MNRPQIIYIADKFSFSSSIKTLKVSASSQNKSKSVGYVLILLHKSVLRTIAVFAAILWWIKEELPVTDTFNVQEMPSGSLSAVFTSRFGPDVAVSDLEDVNTLCKCSVF